MEDLFSFSVERAAKKPRDLPKNFFLDGLSRGQLWSLDSCEIVKDPIETSKENATVPDDSDNENVSDDEDLDVNVLCDSFEKPAAQIYETHVNRTMDQCLVEMSAPQRSPMWLAARECCITASQFGAAVGHHPQTSPNQMLIEKLWSTFKGNPATEWGTFHEPDAAETFRVFFESHFPQNDFLIREYGLLKSPECPQIGVSPDGILQVKNPTTNLYDWYVLEYKCPFQLKNTDGHPQKKQSFNVPPQYFDQIQGILGFLSETLIHEVQDTHIRKEPLPIAKKPRGAFFVVWTPETTQVSFFDFDRTQWAQLKDGLKAFFFEKMLPALTHKINGRLQENSLDASETIFSK